MRLRRKWLAALLSFIVVLVLLAAGVTLLNLRGEAPAADTVPFEATPAQIEHGRYLALAGNCAGCHTVRGGEAYAGGRGIETPFGTVYAGNLTPDPVTGIGRWSADHFWRALHNGRSRDGRLLYPAFPYTSYTQITREDSDALYAWLRTLVPVVQENRPHALSFPYNTQTALAVWRALFFRPGSFEAQSQHSAEWNRGAYLVDVLGHCIDCHGDRNVLGATRTARGHAGGTLPGSGWYAPALDAGAQAGVADWPVDEVVTLFKTGITARASVSGPMADVIYRSTQHLSDADLKAMAVYLKALPPRAEASPARPKPRNAVLMQRGEAIYGENCASCHGEQGEGVAGALPALAANRAVTLANPVNLVQVVRKGGFLPATEGNPRPYGMPPFGHVLADADIAAVLTYVRGSWGNDAAEVPLHQAQRR